MNAVTDPGFSRGGAPTPKSGYANLLLPPENEAWGKVIFLQVSVILLTGGCACSGGCMVPGGAWSRGECMVSGGLVETPPSPTAAGGTHPTGMHSCFSIFLPKTA